jgi:hypothetical protein
MYHAMNTPSSKIKRPAKLIVVVVSRLGVPVDMDHTLGLQN